MRSRAGALALGLAWGLASGLALAGCTAGTPSAGAGGGVAGGEARYVASQGTVTAVPPDQRRPAPALEGTTLDGGTFRLADARGEVVVVNAWASWCPPCRKEAPDLERAWQSLRGQGVQFVGLNEKDGLAEAQAFSRNFGVTYPSLRDEEGLLLLGFRDLPMTAPPSTLVLDRQHRVAARVIGAVDETELRGLVQAVLREEA